MYWPLYLLLTALAAAATYVWMVQQRAVLPTTMVSAALYAVLAAQSRNLEVINGGTEFTKSEPAMQWLMVGMSVLSFLALVLWYWGEYPPDDAVQDELDPEGRPSSPGV